ncbi:FAD-dependent oxidoreductase [Moorella sulfitireducens]|uniref:oxidoreductase n=1 Tax=Neomoorella sulfitireducens TaxID=2972948 RepID=UPI0021AC9219|nr:FAD-dependent oxidoreductase [Moorella sulfitireducens]
MHDNVTKHVSLTPGHPATKKFPNLFSPLQVGSIILRNRIGLAPMSFTFQAPGGGFPEEQIAFLEAVARGGAGLITVGETNVGSTTGRTHENCIMLGDPAMRRGLVRIAEAVHRHGAAVSIEINHGGVFAAPAFNGGKPPMGPSKLSFRLAFNNIDGEEIIEMDEAMMDKVADDFAAAVQTVKECGFDMAQVHMGHGWLLHQFLSPLFNHRTDKYGGSLENRVRFPLMVLDRIRARVGRDFPLDVRISGTEVLEGGLVVEDVARICSLIEDRVNMISVSCGGIYHPRATGRMSPHVFFERGCNVYLAEEVRKHVRVPVSTVGALADPAELEKIIAGGRADFVNMGRALIADHELANKALHGKDNEILHCIRCYTCQHGLFNEPERLMRCAVNPTVGHEARGYDCNVPAGVKKRLLIAGGGPAGMMAALTAARRGHTVILCEQSGRLGGALDFADYVDFKADIKVYKDRLVQWVLDHPGIEVRLNTPVTPELVKEIAPDAFFAALGAEPVLPPIPGINRPHVITGKDVYGRENEIGNRVVIIGGGLLGCETAVHLVRLGRQVTLVEQAGQLAVDATLTHREALIERLEESTIVLLSTRCIEITPKAVICNTGGDKKELEADTVVIAAGMKALTAEAYALGALVTEFRPIGDCRKVGKILNATTDGFFAAMDL